MRKNQNMGSKEAWLNKIANIRHRLQVAMLKGGAVLATPIILPFRHCSVQLGLERD